MSVLKSSTASRIKLIRVHFEVFGKVKGVHFRKYTKNKCLELDLKGWCKRTLNNTIEGVMEGQNHKIEEMKTWLQKIGSPKSEITKVVFSKKKEIDGYSFRTFVIRQ